MHNKKICLLGSTGSIGESTLEVVRQNPERFDVVALSCERSLDSLVKQIEEFHPKAVSVGTGYSKELAALLPPAFSDLEIYEGLDGLNRLAVRDDVDLLVAAIVGAAGLIPIMKAVEKGCDIALANKEPMVLAGELMMAKAAETGSRILPVDSEHNAIFQALAGSRLEDVKYITLTASGGPFRDRPLEQFSEITLQDALKHPNWDMGSKITIDSASMMNKALEVIEARWLFQLPPEQIRVVIHPQSIIHSMVNYKDGSVLAQLGKPDMKIPISYCMGFPERIQSGVDPIDLVEVGQLDFRAPDDERFPTVGLAFRALAVGGGAPAAINGANEALVASFLQERISFTDIFRCLKDVIRLLETSDTVASDLPSYLFKISNVDEAMAADQWGRDFVQNFNW